MSLTLLHLEQPRVLAVLSTTGLTLLHLEQPRVLAVLSTTGLKSIINVTI